MSEQSSLEKYLKSYLADKGSSVGALGFEDYKASRGLDYDSTYTKGVSDAYSRLTASSPYSGSGAESLYEKGLSGSGYAEYLDKRAKSSYESTLKSLLDEKTKSEREALGGYASYLSNYERARESLMKSVRGELIKNNIISLDTAFDYAISAGLSSDEAKSVSAAVYEANRERIMAEIIEKAASLRLNAEAAALLAEKTGLTYEDSRLVAEEVEKYLGENNEYKADESYLKALEEQADGLTTTIKNKKGND